MPNLFEFWCQTRKETNSGKFCSIKSSETMFVGLQTSNPISKHNEWYVHKDLPDSVPTLEANKFFNWKDRVESSKKSAELITGSSTHVSKSHHKKYIWWAESE